MGILKLIALSLVLFVAGCAAQKENKITSVIKSPEKNNSFISGLVEDGNYIAMDKSFTIKIPFQKDSREYNLMEIDEFYFENGTNVVFGVSRERNNIFNLEVIQIINKDNFEKKSKKMLTQYQKDLTLEYRSKPKILKKHRFQIDGHNTIHWNLLQKVKPGSVSGLSYGLVNHQVFAINMDSKIVFIWVQKIANEANKHTNLVTAYDFATSIRFSKKSYDMNLLTSIQ